MPIKRKNVKSERIQIYFDCICGTICSVSALFGIYLVTRQDGVKYPITFVIGLSFMIAYLVISLSVIGLGIATYYRAKNLEPDAIPKKKLRAPMVG